MPLYPAVDPSPSSFPPLPPLDQLEREATRGGRAPWLPSNTTITTTSGEPDFETSASPLVFGCGVFGTGMYNPDQTLNSDLPLRTLRLALDYGINTFDTSPYYFPSEFILGNALVHLSPEHPRHSYFIISKCGRYGPDPIHFDYSPSKVESSIRASCKRLGTDYLDVALMHDVEFVAEKVGRSNHEGWEAAILSGSEAAQPEGVSKPSKQDVEKDLGLLPGLQHASRVHGPGDEKVLDAVRTLFRLKDEGVVKRVGISGYPLPVLLRLSRLVATSPPFRPLDVILSYSNHCLHSSVLEGLRPLFEADPCWKPPIILNGSPFSMGLLTPNPPAWHPASEELKTACVDLSRLLESKGTTLAWTALMHGIRGSEIQSDPTPRLRTLLGLSNPQQVHEAIEAYRTLLSRQTAQGERLLFPIKGEKEGEEEDVEVERRRFQYEKFAESEATSRKLFKERGVSEWSWSSGL
ncbi:Aldo/keto reductase [Violaceomyces palustris]|uniref:Aldo/keto reductase n=1 Tax=Violaceomyces palustris TaxID=1673888 RepID=A0ACD0P1C8_9BASI|nr:Aldo/keto reductase [Violaceomyces palustris]